MAAIYDAAGFDTLDLGGLEEDWRLAGGSAWMTRSMPSTWIPRAAMSSSGPTTSPKVAFAAYDPSWAGLLDVFGQHPAIARWLPEREHLGGPYGALAYVLHLAWILRHLPGPHEAHQRFAPAHLAFSQDLLEQDTLRHLAQDGAGPADVARVLWADVCRLSRVQA